MLVIRDAQVAALAEARVETFVRDLVRALRAEQPALCAKVDVEAMVRAAVARTRDYDITSEAGVGCFARIELVLGPAFDLDPALPWARQILTDPDIHGEEARLGRLRLAAIAHLEKEGR